MQLEERVEYDVEWEDLSEEFETMCNRLGGFLEKKEKRDEEYLICKLPKQEDLGIKVFAEWNGAGNWISILLDGVSIFGEYISKDDELVVKTLRCDNSKIHINPIGYVGEAKYDTLATNVKEIVLSRLKNIKKIMIYLKD